VPLQDTSAHQAGGASADDGDARWDRHGVNPSHAGCGGVFVADGCGPDGPTSHTVDETDQKVEQFYFLICST
jgi:hypothetical protein